MRSVWQVLNGVNQSHVDFFLSYMDRKQESAETSLTSTVEIAHREKLWQNKDHLKYDTVRKTGIIFLMLSATRHDSHFDKKL